MMPPAARVSFGAHSQALPGLVQPHRPYRMTASFGSPVSAFSHSEKPPAVTKSTLLAN